MRKLFNAFLDLLDAPTLVYRVRFQGQQPWVSENTLGANSLLIGSSGIPGENSEPPPSQLVTLNTPHGLKLSITKATDENVAVMCSLWPIPPTLRRFRLLATYTLPEGLGPTNLGDDIWGAALLARDGDPSVIAKATTLVGATHQVRAGGKIVLGVAEATNAAPPPRCEAIESAVAYPIPNALKAFSMETDIDCYSGRGRSRLMTPNYTWTERSWTHSFITERSPSVLLSPITAVGVGLAMVEVAVKEPMQEPVRPVVVVTEFAIKQWSGPAPGWRRWIEDVAQTITKFLRPNLWDCDKLTLPPVQPPIS